MLLYVAAVLLKGISMRKRYLLISCLTVLFMCPLSIFAQSRILYVNACHAGYVWNVGITEKIKATANIFNPNVVIAPGDNASKYLIQPYYINTDPPVVYCGVNYRGDAYGYPDDNITDMVAVLPMPRLTYFSNHFNRAEK